MANPKLARTLDDETFEWIENQKPLRCRKCGTIVSGTLNKIMCPKKGHPLMAWGDVCSADRPGRPARAEVGRRRQRYYAIRNVARKEIADLTKLAKTLPNDQLNQIFNVDALEPIVRIILGGPEQLPPHPDGAQLDLERAKIADLFIKWGFEYLSSMNSDMMSVPHRNTMEAAIDLSRFLLETFPPKWKYYPEIHGKQQHKTDSQGDEEK